MLGAVTAWFTALSTAGKVGVVSAAVLTGGITSAAITTETAPSAPVTVPNEAETKCNPSTTKVTETESIPYNKVTEEDPNTEKGKTYIKVTGVNGTKTFTYNVTTYTPTGCKNDEKVQEGDPVITTEPVAEVTAVGTYSPPQPPPPNCDPNYSPCVPLVNYDLDCPDIGFTVYVKGSDPHRFDRDGDGYGCE